ncbi:MAG: energy transducer TonB [Myxococcales bacterium]|nr:energy transducer TonB [Myxococcales bacterium]
MDSRDLNALLAALILHTGGAFALVTWGQSRPKAGPQFVQVDVRRNKPPPPALPPPKIEPPPPPKLREKVAVPKPLAPIPNQTRTPPPDQPPPPVHYGATAESTTEGESTFSVPVGNTTIADPKTATRKIEEVRPLPPAPPAAVPAPVFKAASALMIKTEPEVVEGSCDIPYPDGEAKQNGVEGDTLLRVEIDERGRVHGVKLIKGVGYGLDEVAIRAMRQRCRFGPAKDTANQPVSFVITYTYHWLIDR